MERPDHVIVHIDLMEYVFGKSASSYGRDSPQRIESYRDGVAGKTYTVEELFSLAGCVLTGQVAHVEQTVRRREGSSVIEQTERFEREDIFIGPSVHARRYLIAGILHGGRWISLASEVKLGSDLNQIHVLVDLSRHLAPDLSWDGVARPEP